MRSWLQVTIIRQTFQYVDVTCSVLTVWDFGKKKVILKNAINFLVA